MLKELRPCLSYPLRHSLDPPLPPYAARARSRATQFLDLVNADRRREDAMGGDYLDDDMNEDVGSLLDEQVRCVRHTHKGDHAALLSCAHAHGIHNCEIPCHGTMRVP